MWKWTDQIELIVIDDHSLVEDIKNYDYSKIDNAFQIKKISDATSENKFLYDPLAILTKGKIASKNIVLITSDDDICKQAIEYRIGTILVKEIADINYSGFLPDFLVDSLDDVINCLNREKCGYFGEVLVNNLYGIVSIGEYNVKMKQKRSFDLLYGGRYYPTNNEYIKNDLLSTCILKFKSSLYFSNLFNSYCEDVITIVHEEIEKVDIVCSVPLKPSQRNADSNSRFEILKLQKVQKQCVVNHSVLKCNKEYTHKNSNIYERKLNVINAFSVEVDVNDKHIVLLDDIYTTGSTVSEIVRVLYLNGARKVTVIVFAINQLIVAKSHKNQYKYFKCLSCDSNMLLRVNKKELSLFWGCENYKNCNSITVNLKKGIENVKSQNSIFFDVVEDYEVF